MRETKNFKKFRASTGGTSLLFAYMPTPVHNTIVWGERRLASMLREFKQSTELNRQKLNYCYCTNDCSIKLNFKRFIPLRGV